jgi:hypothetical protein
LPGHTETVEFIKFNHDLSGFYTCNYLLNGIENESQAGIREVKGLLMHLYNLNSLDRFGILSDLRLNGGLTPGIISYYELEDDIGVWYLAYSYLKEKLI